MNFYISFFFPLEPRHGSCHTLPYPFITSARWLFFLYSFVPTVLWLTVISRQDNNEIGNCHEVISSLQSFGKHKHENKHTISLSRGRVSWSLFTSVFVSNTKDQCDCMGFKQIWASTELLKGSFIFLRSQEIELEPSWFGTPGQTWPRAACAGGSFPLTFCFYEFDYSRYLI